MQLGRLFWVPLIPNLGNKFPVMGYFVAAFFYAPSAKMFLLSPACNNFHNRWRLAMYLTWVQVVILVSNIFTAMRFHLELYHAHMLIL
jgi:hypothetical protein